MIKVFAAAAAAALFAAAPALAAERCFLADDGARLAYVQVGEADMLFTPNGEDGVLCSSGSAGTGVPARYVLCDDDWDGFAEYPSDDTVLFRDSLFREVACELASSFTAPHEESCDLIQPLGIGCRFEAEDGSTYERIEHAIWQIIYTTEDGRGVLCSTSSGGTGIPYRIAHCEDGWTGIVGVTSELERPDARMFHDKVFFEVCGPAEDLRG